MQRFVADATYFILRLLQARSGRTGRFNRLATSKLKETSIAASTGLLRSGLGSGLRARLASDEILPSHRQKHGNLPGRDLPA
jgi:hypothetical protein